jgi:GTP cyclohydrolase II
MFINRGNFQSATTSEHAAKPFYGVVVYLPNPGRWIGDIQMIGRDEAIPEDDVEADGVELRC